MATITQTEFTNLAGIDLLSPNSKIIRVQGTTAFASTYTQGDGQNGRFLKDHTLLSTGVRASSTYGVLWFNTGTNIVLGYPATDDGDEPTLDPGFTNNLILQNPLNNWDLRDPNSPRSYYPRGKRVAIIYDELSEWTSLARDNSSTMFRNGANVICVGADILIANDVTTIGNSANWRLQRFNVVDAATNVGLFDSSITFTNESTAGGTSSNSRVKFLGGTTYINGLSIDFTNSGPTGTVEFSGAGAGAVNQFDNVRIFDSQTNSRIRTVVMINSQATTRFEINNLLARNAGFAGGNSAAQMVLLNPGANLLKACEITDDVAGILRVNRTLRGITVDTGLNLNVVRLTDPGSDFFGWDYGTVSGAPAIRPPVGNVRRIVTPSYVIYDSTANLTTNNTRNFDSNTGDGQWLDGGDISIELQQYEMPHATDNTRAQLNMTNAYYIAFTEYGRTARVLTSNLGLTVPTAMGLTDYVYRLGGTHLSGNQVIDTTYFSPNDLSQRETYGNEIAIGEVELAPDMNIRASQTEAIVGARTSVTNIQDFYESIHYHSVHRTDGNRVFRGRQLGTVSADGFLTIDRSINQSSATLTGQPETTFAGIRGGASGVVTARSTSTNTILRRATDGTVRGLDLVNVNRTNSVQAIVEMQNMSIRNAEIGSTIASGVIAANVEFTNCDIILSGGGTNRSMNGCSMLSGGTDATRSRFNVGGNTTITMTNCDLSGVVGDAEPGGAGTLTIIDGGGNTFPAGNFSTVSRINIIVNVAATPREVVLNIPASTNGRALITNEDSTAATIAGRTLFSAVITNGTITWTQVGSLGSLNAQGRPEIPGNNTMSKAVYYKLDSTATTETGEARAFRTRIFKYTTRNANIVLEPIEINNVLTSQAVTLAGLTVTPAASTARRISLNWSIPSPPSDVGRSILPASGGQTQAAVMLGLNNINYLNWMAFNQLTEDPVDYEDNGIVTNYGRFTTPPETFTSTEGVFNTTTSAGTVVFVSNIANTRSSFRSDVSSIPDVNRVIVSDELEASVATLSRAISGIVASAIDESEVANDTGDIKNAAGFLVSNRLGTKGRTPWSSLNTTERNALGDTIE